MWIPLHFISLLHILVFCCCCSKSPTTNSVALEQHKSIILHFCSLKSDMNLSGLKFSICRTEFLSGVSRDESVSFTFPAFPGCPHLLDHGPLPSSKPAMADWVFTISTFWLWVFCIPLTFKNTYDDSGSTRLI